MFSILMAHYTSNQARLIDALRTSIIGIINQNLSNFTEAIFHIFKYGILDAIHQIEEMLHHDNVRVRDHPKLRIPVLPQDPKIRKMLKRLENTVHVLCILADTIAGGQGPAVTQEETQSVVDGDRILALLMDNLQEIFPHDETE